MVNTIYHTEAKCGPAEHLEMELVHDGTVQYGRLGICAHIHSG
jgi:hypothetical protein